MNDVKILSASQIRKDGLQALEEKLGVVGTIRFLQQLDNGGKGDYTKEKYEKEDITLTREEIYEQMGETSADKKIDGKRDLVRETKELLDCLPEEDIALVNLLVKKFILAWDPYYTKFSHKEAENLKAAEQEMKAGMFFSNKDVGF